MDSTTSQQFVPPFSDEQSYVSDKFAENSNTGQEQIIVLNTKAQCSNSLVSCNNSLVSTVNDLEVVDGSVGKSYDTGLYYYIVF